MLFQEANRSEHFRRKFGTPWRTQTGEDEHSHTAHGADPAKAKHQAILRRLGFATRVILSIRACSLVGAGLGWLMLVFLEKNTVN